MRQLVALVIALMTSSAIASCPELYPRQLAIVPASSTTVEVCRSFFVTHYDQGSRGTRFVSQRLRPFTPIGSPKRLSGFRADPQVRNSPRNDHYTGTGWDKGHLVPAEDSSTGTEMYDTFYLTNVVPQSPALNRGQWKALEAKLRTIAATAKQDVYIVTIPVYADNDIMSGAIPIPTGLWKILIIGNDELYFFATNRANATVAQYYKIDWRQIIMPVQ